MSPSLPPEILDAIIEHLHDEPTTLKTCSIVSESWVPRTRSHLFALVEFHASESHLEAWKKIFPDPSNSPAHHTRTLSISGAPVVTASDGWIRAFHNLKCLMLENMDRSALAQFYGLSPTVRSLRLAHTTADVFDLICSFPFLEDLALFHLHPDSEADERNTHSTSPKLTASFHMMVNRELHSVAYRLCALPNGLHFTDITIGFGMGDTEPATSLISKCSHTLESLTIHFFDMLGTSRTPFLDLSKNTKLRDLSFRWKSFTVQWITTVLQTIRSKSLEHITIHPAITEDAIFQEWWDLDRLLVQFWTLHPIRLQVNYGVGGENDGSERSNAEFVARAN